MRRVLGAAALVVIVAAATLSWGTTSVHADTPSRFVSVVALRTDAGDATVDPGQSHLYLSSSASISVSGSTTDTVTVTASDAANAEDPWDLSFAAPEGGTLSVGTYKGAARVSDRGTRPGVDLSPEFGCVHARGRFTVRDISDDLSHLDLTYVIRCDWDGGPIFGQISIGEATDGSGLLVAPNAIDWPAYYPGTESAVVPVTLVNTTDGPITVSGAAITDGQSTFAVSGNSCSVLAAGASCAIDLQFRPQGVAAQSGQLTITNSSTAGHHVVQLSGRGISGYTSFRMRSDPEDWVGQGQTYDFSPANSSLMVGGDRSLISMRLTSPGIGDWLMYFSAGSSGHLKVGRRYKAVEYPGNGAGPGMSIGGDGRGCDLGANNSFTVQQASFDWEGRVTAFAVTFEQHCVGAIAGLFGSIAWRAPLPPATVPKETTPPVSHLIAVPANGSAFLNWANPSSRHWEYTVVRQATGLTPPPVDQTGLPLYAGRAHGLAIHALPPGKSYSWTVFPVYASGRHGQPRHVSLRGSAMRLATNHPRVTSATSFRLRARLFDHPSNTPLAGRLVTFYYQSGSGHWKVLRSAHTDAHGVAIAPDLRENHTTNYLAVFDGGGHHLGISSRALKVTLRAAAG
jgi:hypothetical protein